MTQYFNSWELSRGRFDQCIFGFTTNGLNYRLYPGCLTAGEMAIHVAGVEIFFAGQMLGCTFSEYEEVSAAARDGVVNDNPFPVPASKITPEYVKSVLDAAREIVLPLLQNPISEQLNVEMVSALGPIISGEGALARFAFHPGYHHGQAYMISQAPGFPRD